MIEGAAGVQIFLLATGHHEELSDSKAIIDVLLMHAAVIRGAQRRHVCLPSMRRPDPDPIRCNCSDGRQGEGLDGRSKYSAGI